MEQKKKQFKRIIWSITIIIFLIYFSAFYLNWIKLNEAYIIEENLWIISLIIIIRMLIFVAMSFILFSKWFKQEAVYTSDAYFLFAVFFAIITAGKILDLFWNLTFISEGFSTEFTLVLLKVRFSVIVLNAFPLLFIGLEALITIFNTYIKNMTKKQFNKARLITIIIFLGIVSVIIIIAPTIDLLSKLLPIITAGTMIGIVIMFFFMYKNKRLSQANGLIIGLGFLLAVISSFIRSILNASLASTGLIYAELLDMLVYFIIFAGFMTKPKYARK